MNPQAYELTRKYDGPWNAADLSAEEDRIWIQVRRLRQELSILYEVADYLAARAKTDMEITKWRREREIVK